MSGDFINVSLFTAECLFDHIRDLEISGDNLYETVKDRLGYPPEPYIIQSTVQCCGFRNVGGILKTNNPELTSRLTNEYLSALYGYLAAKEETDPSPMDYTASLYNHAMRSCYSFDYMTARPYVLRYLYYERETSDYVLMYKIENLWDKIGPTRWIDYGRFKLGCARVLNECGYKKRSNRDRCFDPVRIVTRGDILRSLELCHRELSGDLPPKQVKKTKNDGGFSIAVKSAGTENEPCLCL